MLEHRLVNLAEQQSQNYGTALARMAAQQSVDAALNHDLVSLQVILQDVAANPGVLLATMHDVTNNLLVQAGNAVFVRTTEEPVSTHTAPVTLHDSIAGYVTVTFAAPDTRHNIALITISVISLLLILIAALALYEVRGQVFVRRERACSITEEVTPACDDPAEESLQQSHDESPSEHMDDEPYRAFALLRVDAAELRQQLTAEIFNATLESLDQLLDDVLALYNGRAIDRTSRAGEYLLQFDSTESCAEAAFRATCSLSLTMRLAAHLQPVNLTPGALIALDNTAMVDRHVCPVVGELLIEAEAAEEGVLDQRLVLSEAPDQRDHYYFENFQQPFAALLERQYQQLKKLLPEESVGFK